MEFSNCNCRSINYSGVVSMSEIWGRIVFLCWLKNEPTVSWYCSKFGGSVKRFLIFFGAFYAEFLLPEHLERMACKSSPKSCQPEIVIWGTFFDEMLQSNQDGRAAGIAIVPEDFFAFGDGIEWAAFFDSHQNIPAASVSYNMRFAGFSHVIKLLNGFSG